jgi:hypothetical protein
MSELSTPLRARNLIPGSTLVRRLGKVLRIMTIYKYERETLKLATYNGTRMKQVSICSRSEREDLCFFSFPFFIKTTQLIYGLFF